jgi:hypothetical protein
MATVATSNQRLFAGFPMSCRNHVTPFSVLDFEQKILKQVLIFLILLVNPLLFPRTHVPIAPLDMPSSIFPLQVKLSGPLLSYLERRFLSVRFPFSLLASLSQPRRGRVPLVEVRDNQEVKVVVVDRRDEDVAVVVAVGDAVHEVDV